MQAAVVRDASRPALMPQVLKDYDALREADPTDVPIAASQKPVNSQRNRYFNVIPYDCNRVVLQGVSERSLYLTSVTVLLKTAGGFTQLL